MNEECYEVKRNAYAVVCITADYHGSVIVWDTLEQAEQDAEERVKDLLQECPQLEAIKVDNGYELLNKFKGKVVRCYKIFDAQELE